jgi:hypothetical protein
MVAKQTLGKSSKPNLVAGGKDQSQDALVNHLPAGVYTQELNRVFGLGSQDDTNKNEDGAVSSSASPLLVVLTPANEDEAPAGGYETSVTAEFT